MQGPDPLEELPPAGDDRGFMLYRRLILERNHRRSYLIQAIQGGATLTGLLLIAAYETHLHSSF
jgi:hypothetical protein